ncbi:hypothetical protein IMY05_C4593000200 [Salix suchowensis]|nr:hypothetical protein IMY05_C4593000200 [Salix suchowensis]
MALTQEETTTSSVCTHCEMGSDRRVAACLGGKHRHAKFEIPCADTLLCHSYGMDEKETQMDPPASSVLAPPALATRGRVTDPSRPNEEYDTQEIKEGPHKETRKWRDEIRKEKENEREMKGMQNHVIPRSVSDTWKGKETGNQNEAGDIILPTPQSASSLLTLALVNASHSPPTP